MDSVTVAAAALTGLGVALAAQHPSMSTCGEGERCEPWKVTPGLVDPVACQAEHPPLAAHESAVVFTHNLYGGGVSEKQFAMAPKWQAAGIDVVLITPPEDHRDDSPWTRRAKRSGWRLGQTRALSADERAMLRRLNVIHHVVPWALPPGLTDAAEGCASMDFLRLHVLNLTRYKAVLYLDGDVSVIGDVRPLLRCAASGKLLMTSGIMSPLNYGLKAVKPSAAMFAAVAWFAGRAGFLKMPPKGAAVGALPPRLGWDGAGPAPYRGHFQGYGCGQGLGWTFFYGNGPHAGRPAHLFASVSPLAVEAHKKFPYNITAHLLDRCVWNYQVEDPNRGCAKGFSCSKIQIVHKGHKKLHFNHLRMKRGVCGNCTLHGGCLELSRAVAPTETGWTLCGTEGMQCKCDTRVKFGWWRPELGVLGTSFEPRAVRGSIRCHAKDFGGDPAPRAQKACFCQQGEPAATAPSRASAPAAPPAVADGLGGVDAAENSLRAALVAAAAKMELGEVKRLAAALEALETEGRRGATRVPLQARQVTLAPAAAAAAARARPAAEQSGLPWYARADADQIAQAWLATTPTPAAWRGKGPCGVAFPRPPGCSGDS